MTARKAINSLVTTHEGASKQADKKMIADQKFWIRFDFGFDFGGVSQPMHPEERTILPGQQDANCSAGALNDTMVLLCFTFGRKRIELSKSAGSLWYIWVRSV